MNLTLLNKTGSPLAYLTGSVTVPANGSTVISDMTQQLTLANDGQLRADIFSSSAQVSDGTNNYGSNDAITYLDKIPLAIITLINIRRFSMGLTTLIDATTIAVDGSQGPTYQVTLGGNHTLDNPTSQVAGQVYTFLIYQDSTGSRTLSYGNLYKFQNAVTPTMTTTAGGLDVQTFVSDGTYMVCTGSQTADQPVVVAPSSLTASTGQTGTIALSWHNNDPTATDFQIWSNASGFGFGNIGTTGSGSITTYTDSEPTGTYIYYIVAVRGTAVSAPSNQATGSCL